MWLYYFSISFPKYADYFYSPIQENKFTHIYENDEFFYLSILISWNSFWRHELPSYSCLISRYIYTNSFNLIPVICLIFS